jgi:hypothetical protein
MISQFRTLNPFNILLLVCIALLLRAGFLLRLPPEIPLGILDPFKKLMLPVPAYPELSPFANVLMSGLISVIQGLLLNKVVNSYNLNGKPSFIPALMYVTASGLLPPFLTLSLPLIVNFLLIWITYRVLGIYRKEEARSSMYDLGMIAGAGTLLYFPFISMLPLLWISLIIFRPFNWREWLAVILGFATIYFFIAFFYYWNDSFDLFYKIWIPLSNHFAINLKLDRANYIVFVPVALILTFTIFLLQKKLFRGYVQVSKSFQVTFAMLMLCIISFYLEPGSGLVHFVMAAVPAAILMGYYFVNAGIKWLYETLYLILALCIIYFQWA